MARASNSVRTVIQLLTLLIVALTGVTGSLPLVGETAASPVSQYLPSQSALQVASPELRFERSPSGSDYEAGDDAIQGDPVADPIAEYLLSAGLHPTSPARLPKHCSASYLARAPPAPELRAAA